MISDGDQRPCADLLYTYQVVVKARHGEAVNRWPLLNGWKSVHGSFGDWQIIFLQDDPFSGVTRFSGCGELNVEVIGATHIDGDNREEVRRRLEKHFGAGHRDAVLMYPPDNNVENEYQYLLNRHERAQGLIPMKIFLSHKGADKPKVREFKNTLALMGFTPWLDEDNMKAGVELERGILKGFEESCAAVFFITANFKDENFLSTEVNYAMAEKRRKGDRFAIITIVFDAAAARSNVPALLRQYVWKEPVGDLEAMREIVAALPIAVGDVHWR